MKKIVLTGAAGNLGHVLREPLSKLAQELVSVDVKPLRSDLLGNERFETVDVGQMDQIAPLIEGADMVVHFGAVVDERSFPELLGTNFVGSYNIWEAARQSGVRRIVYASSIHAMGMYPKTDPIPVDRPHRPDTFYGLAKCFTEDLARMYWEKNGIESVHLRILSCLEKPTTARALGTWLSHPDLIQLVTRAIDTPITGFTVLYGVSNNDRCPVDNSGADFLGYRPQDNAEDYAAELLGEALDADPQDLGQMCHGGPFASTGIGVSPMAQMKIPGKS